MTTRSYVDLPDWHMEADVVIVGYGGAGATAAITAHDAGSSVLILEKLPADVVDSQGNVVEVRHHPNSRMSGALHLCATNAEDLFTYQKAKIAVFGMSDVPDDTLWAWAQEVARNHEWLWSLGADYETYFLRPNMKTATPEEKEQGFALAVAHPELPGADSIYGIRAYQTGWGWFDLLSRNVQKRGIEVLYRTPAMELVQDPRTKEILGVLAEDHRGRTLAI
ncbi:MAG: FAD-binding protein, partial [Chloroflexi bacterium]|nr:FAD-binding protein [Chloroflexota bacterium]